MAQPDAIMTRMVEGLALSQQGQRTAARTLWEALWASVGERGDPLHRCALAHHLADVQDDPAAELSWDLRAWKPLTPSPANALLKPVSPRWPASTRRCT
jgi:hypothetical protein